MFATLFSRRALVRDRDAANRDVLKACAVLGVMFAAAACAAFFWRLDLEAPLPRDGALVMGRDFLNVWMQGRAAWLPEPWHWYDAETYRRVLAILLGNDYPAQAWTDPPAALLIAAPFGKLGYLAALGGWTAFGLAIYLATLARFFSDGHARLAALCAPAAIVCILSGQSALITTALLLGSFALLDRRPIVAGVLIGLLTLKPQLVVLFPVLLIAQGRWRVLASAAVTALALAGASAALFGIETWTEYAKSLPVLRPSDPAAVIQIVMTLGAGATVFWAFRHRADADPKRLAALFLACAIAAVPSLLAYDTLALALMALGLLEAGALDRRERLVARLVYWLPLLQIGFDMLQMPGPVLIAPAFAALLAMKLRRERAATLVLKPA